MDNSPSPASPRRHLIALLGLTVMLALPVEALAQGSAPATLLLAGSTSTPPSLRLPLPLRFDIDQDRLETQERLETMWNSRGSLRATLGGRELLSVSAEVRPGALLLVNEEKGVIEVETGNDMLTEEERSIQLVIERTDGGWALTGGKVRTNGRDYFLRSGEVSILELDPGSGLIEATFSFVGRSDETESSELHVSNGTLRLRRSQ